MDISSDRHLFVQTDYFIGKKNYFLAWIIIKIALLPPPDHEKSIGILGYQIGSKLREEVVYGHIFVTESIIPKFIT